MPTDQEKDAGMGRRKHQLLGLISAGAGAVKGWELFFLPLQRVTGAFLLPGTESSPASLHKARKRISSLCSFRDGDTVEREENLETNDLNSSLSSLYLGKKK